MFSRRRLVVLKIGNAFARRLRAGRGRELRSVGGMRRKPCRRGVGIGAAKGRDFFVINCAFLANFIEKIRKIWYN